MTEQEPADGTSGTGGASGSDGVGGASGPGGTSGASGASGDAAANRWRTLATAHRLISGLAGRLPDPLITQAREWLGREDVVGLAEVIVTSAITQDVGVTPQEAETLAALPAAPGRRPGLPDGLRISDPAAQPSSSVVFRIGPPGAPDDLDRALVASVFREPKVVAIRRSTRSVTDIEDHRVYLLEAASGAELWRLAAEAQRALQLRGVEAPQVEAYWTGDTPTGYQQAALAASLRLWARPGLPERGATVFGAAADRERAARVTEWFQWSGEVWGTMTRLHRLLLRLAADLPAEQLAGLRRSLAEGELAAFSVGLASILDGSRLALTASELAVLREIPRQIEEPGLDLSALDRVPVADDAASTVAGSTVAGSPQSATGFDLRPAPDEGLDAGPTLVLMMASQPGVLQVWRAWRASPGGGAAVIPVFLIEVDPGLAAWDVAFDAQLAQAPAGPAQVEVFWSGEELPEFHLAALKVADPLWISTLEESPHTGGIRTTGVYDFADPDGVPRFSAEHVRLPDPAECDRLAARMMSGDIVVSSPAAAEDVIDPARGRVVPQDHRTDGEWIWRESAAYYLAEYQLAPHPDLLAHLRRMERGADAADA